MKLKKIILLILLCFVALFAQAQIRDKISIKSTDFKSGKTQEFDRIDWRSDCMTDREGEPELPVYRVSYVLPIDAQITGVTFCRKKSSR